MKKLGIKCLRPLGKFCDGKEVLKWLQNEEKERGKKQVCLTCLVGLREIQRGL